MFGGGGDSGGSSTTTTELEGTWVSACEAAPPPNMADTKTTVEVSGSSATYTQRNYAQNTNCSNEGLIIKREGQISIGQAIAGGKALDFTNITTEVTPKINGWSLQSCATPQPLNQTTDVTGCTGASRALYTIFKIEGNQLDIPTPASDTTAGRPQNFTNATTFTKQ